MRMLKGRRAPADASDGPPAAGLWRNRNWRLLWIGQSVSAVGDMVFYMTVLLWIATIIAYRQPWAPAAASGALIATAAPVLIVGPIAGVYVDRWNRRTTMLVADAARFALIASLLILPSLRHTIPVIVQLSVLYIVLAVCSIFAQFFDPSRLALLGEVVPPKDQPKASAQLQAAFSTAQIIGPPVAAPLLINLGVQWALLLNALSFVVSFACVRAIKTPGTPAIATADSAPAGFMADLRDGLRFFSGNRILVILGVGIVLAMLGNGAVNSLAVFFIPHNLHEPAKWLGTVIGSAGAGSVVGALSTAAIVRRVRPSRLFPIALIVCGVALIAFSRTTSLPPAIAFAVLLGLGAGVTFSSVSPIVLSVTPSNLLGRVSAMLTPVEQLAQIVSMVLAGALASTVLRGFHASIAGVTFGPYDTIFFVGGMLFLLGGLVSFSPLSRVRGDASAAERPASSGRLAAAQLDGGAASQGRAD
jgi:MFS family permease